MAGILILTDGGLAALAYASAHGTQIQPTTFKFSNDSTVYEDGGNLDPTITESAWVGADVWYTHAINTYTVLGTNLNYVEFICECPEITSTEACQCCGLFLGDGTLFAMAKPPYPIPAEVRQFLRLQVAYTNIVSLTDFTLIPVTLFLDLYDTPASYSGQALKVVRVNAGENALEFADLTASSILDIDDITDSNYTDKAGYILEVDSDEDSMSLVPVNQEMVERTYEDLGFVATKLAVASRPKSIVIYYFDTGYSGSYSLTGVGAVAKIEFKLGATVEKSCTLVYSGESIDTVTYTRGAESIEYDIAYDGTTGNVSSISVDVP